MARGEEYLTYEQVLQELQINRTQLNHLVREGALREHAIEGETKFRLSEVEALKKELEKRPTVSEEAIGEPATDVVGTPGAKAPSGEPETEMLETEGPVQPERETDLLEEVKASSIQERDTEILEEEEAPAGAELRLEVPAGQEEELELEKPLSEEPLVSDTALDTQLDLKAIQTGKGAGEAEAAEERSEEFFDFSDALDEEQFELEEPVAGARAEEPEAEAAELEEEETPITDILGLSEEEEVAEEDLLSEIMEIEEEQEPEAVPTEASEEVTAEITTLEEPTYEEGDLGEVLEVEEADLGEEFIGGEEFEVPYAAPVPIAAAQVSGGWVLLLALSLIVMIFGGLFVVENGFRPDFSTPLTSWVPVGPK